jgi:hypothetical protein
MLNWSDRGRRDCRDVFQAWEKCVQKVRNPKLKSPMKRSARSRRIMLKWTLNMQGVKVWTGFIQFRIVSGGWLLWTLFAQKMETSPTEWLLSCQWMMLYGVSYFFLCLGVRWDWVHLVRQPLTGLLYQPRMIHDECGAVELELVGETEAFGENLPQCHFSTTNPTWPNLGWHPGHRGEKPATNCLSYGTAMELARRYMMDSMQM